MGYIDFTVFTLAGLSSYYRFIGIIQHYHFNPRKVAQMVVPKKEHASFEYSFSTFSLTVMIINYAVVIKVLVVLFKNFLDDFKDMTPPPSKKLKMAKEPKLKSKKDKKEPKPKKER